LLEAIRGNRQTPAVLYAAATFALASVHESLASLDEAGRAAGLAEAEKLYRELQEQGASRFRGSPFVALAAERSESLGNLKTPIVFAPGDPPTPTPQPTDAAFGTEPRVEVGAEGVEQPRRMTPEEIEAAIRALQAGGQQVPPEATGGVLPGVPAPTPTPSGEQPQPAPNPAPQPVTPAPQPETPQPAPEQPAPPPPGGSGQ
jgi:hypothetical protein